MKIGVDAYYLYMEKIDGIGNYVLGLMEELSRIDNQNQYFLYTPGVKNFKNANNIFSNPNFILKEINGIFNNRRRLWHQSPSLRRQIINDDIDLFFAGGEYFPLFLPEGILITATIHDVIYKTLPNAISISNKLYYNLFMPFYVKRADIIFTDSEYSGSEIRRYLNIGGKEINVIYLGIDLEKYSAKQKNDKKDYILFVGTLQPRKNLVNLIKAYSLIADKVAESLVVVGASGWKNSNLKKVIENLPEGIAKKVRFSGYIPDDELLKLYKEAKLFALPSLHEGFGLPILEAMASGTPVLSSRRGSIPELFKDAVEYADPLSPADIADRLESLLTDDARRAELQKKGLELSKEYDIKIEARNYLKKFDDIAIAKNINVNS